MEHTHTEILCSNIELTVLISLKHKYLSISLHKHLIFSKNKQGKLLESFLVVQVLDGMRDAVMPAYTEDVTTQIYPQHEKVSPQTHWASTSKNPLAWTKIHWPGDSGPMLMQWLDKGVLYKPVGSKLGCISVSIIIFLVIHSMPLISELYIYIYIYTYIYIYIYIYI